MGTLSITVNAFTGDLFRIYLFQDIIILYIIVKSEANNKPSLFLKSGHNGYFHNFENKNKSCFCFLLGFFINIFAQVLILSGKGGVGKSTVAASLAYALANLNIEKPPRVCRSDQFSSMLQIIKIS